MDKAFYTIHPKAIPASFSLPQTQLGELMNRRVERYNFEKELHYISRYEDMRQRTHPVESHTGQDDVVLRGTIAELEAVKIDMGTTANANPPSPTVVEYESRFKRIEEMMQQTQQEREVCLFYLESTNWNVQEAVSLFKNTT